MIKMKNDCVELNGTVKELLTELSVIAGSLYKNLHLTGVSEEEAEHKVMAAFKAGIMVEKIKEMEEKDADR